MGTPTLVRETDHACLAMSGANSRSTALTAQERKCQVVGISMVYESCLVAQLLRRRVPVHDAEELSRCRHRAHSRFRNWAVNPALTFEYCARQSSSGHDDLNDVNRDPDLVELNVVGGCGC